MMILRSSPSSPFVRKVLIAAAVLGMSDLMETVIAAPNDPADLLLTQNPLGKIPTLIPEDQTPIFDSRVIVEYLDQRAGGNRLIPLDPQARFAAFTLAALADGIVDACVLLIYEECFRTPDMRNAKWIEFQQGKVTRGLAVFEASPPTGRHNIVHIGLACALGYLDLRCGGAWRCDCPRLVEWLNVFTVEVPAFEATRLAS
jgi:glutathione S-transferase